MKESSGGVMAAAKIMAISAWRMAHQSASGVAIMKAAINGVMYEIGENQ